MTRRSSDIDSATRSLYERVRDSSDLIERVARRRSVSRLDATVVVVPGAFHRTHSGTGADGREVREEAARLGARTDIIPLPNLATIRDNARSIREWLRRRDDGRIILVSLSKGSADLKEALSKPDAFDHVIGWVNVSGALDGSPLVDWLFSGAWRGHWTRFLLRIRGHDIAAIRELRHDPSPVSLPAHMRAIHVVGFPRERDLTSALARRCHRRIAHLGPNDGGGLLLSDVLNWPGFVYPVWGADHYLRGRGDLIRQVLGFIADVEAPA